MYRIWYRENRYVELPRGESSPQKIEIKLPWFTRRIQVEIPINYERMSPYHLNQRVVVKSANNKPYWIGHVTDVDAVENCVKPVPKVRDAEGKEWICMGIVRDYSDSLVGALDKLNPIEQWNVMAQNYQIHDEESKEQFLC
jgi:hypothetical protein